MTLLSMQAALGHIADERMRQDRKFPDQHLPDGTATYNRSMADHSRAVCDVMARDDHLTWAHVLSEEFWEALAETDVVKLREELVQVAAVACRWIEDIDSR